VNAEIEKLAEQLWDTAPNRAACPAWSQLGDVTKSVWRERAEAQLFGDFA
jgi:hypothetical protein